MTNNLSDEDVIRLGLHNNCYEERKPEVCHLLGDFFELIKKDYHQAAGVFKITCMQFNFGRSCLKYGDYVLAGRGTQYRNSPIDALDFYEKGCALNEPSACFHAGVLLSDTHPTLDIERNVSKGRDYLSKACKFNNVMACLYLTTIYQVGVPKNPDALQFIKTSKKFDYGHSDESQTSSV